MNVVAGRIDAERKRLGYSKTAFSRELGITYRTYCNYMRGGSVSSKTLVHLAMMTGKSTDYLLGLIQEKEMKK